MAARYRARAGKGVSDDDASEGGFDDDGPLKHVQPESAYVRFVWQVTARLQSGSCT